MTSIVLSVNVERAINHLPDCPISAFALVASRNGLCCIFKVHQQFIFLQFNHSIKNEYGVPTISSKTDKCW